MAKHEEISIRKIKVGEDEFPYRLRYSKRAKYLRLQISSGGLEMILPYGYNLFSAENFLSGKKSWIKKHLIKRNNKQEKFLLFGNEISVVQEFDFFIKKHRTRYEKNILTITSPPNNNVEIKKLYELWLKHQAKNYLIDRVNALAAKYHFAINKISIRGQKTRWGSCSARRNLSFNYKLIQYRKEIIDYVIVHELCHLLEMNHSKKFWILVERLCPDYRILKSDLKERSAI